MSHLQYINKLLDEISKHPNVTVTVEENPSQEKIEYIKGYLERQNNLKNPQKH